tara:strand:- start:877 stop:1632 length:756 start_codon:yes stop_codon:yes gene_type:complete
MSKKIVVFADSDVGLEITKFLVKDFYEDIAHVVLTSHDSIIKEICNESAIDVSVYGSDKYNEFIKNTTFDVGFLIWWPKIISEELINKAKFGFINTHPSFLPFSRGKHYNFWTLVEETKFGVTLHYVNKGIDSGDIIYQKRINYDWLDNGESLFNKAKTEMINMFKEFYPLFRNDKLSAKKQNLKEGSYHHSSEIEKISELDLDKSYKLRNILNLLRGRTFNGHPACSFYDRESLKSYYVRVSITEKPEQE